MKQATESFVFPSLFFSDCEEAPGNPIVYAINRIVSVGCNAIGCQANLITGFAEKTKKCQESANEESLRLLLLILILAHAQSFGHSRRQAVTSVARQVGEGGRNYCGSAQRTTTS